MIVGADNADDFGQGSGAAYVFSKDASGTWHQEARLTEPGAGGQFNFFGDAVEISGNIALVGKRGGFGVGAVFVFQRDPSGVWLHRSTLVGSEAAALHAFGSPIEFDGERAIVGAVGDSAIAELAGAAYVFRMIEPTLWVEEAILRPSDAGPNQRFGAAIAMRQNLVAVGAPGSEGLSIESGAAYIFEQTAEGVWAERARLEAPSLTPSDLFGRSVGLCERSLVVGAPKRDSMSLADSGAAYMFRLENDAWSFEQELPNPHPSVGAGFGWSATVYRGRAAVGAIVSSGSGVQAGAGYIFDRQGGVWALQESLYDSDPMEFALVGTSVAWRGNQVALGAPNKNAKAAIAAGAVLVYDLSTVICPRDINADGMIDTADLGLLIARFGDSGCACAAEDVNADGAIDTADLGLVIAGFGQPCP